MRHEEAAVLDHQHRHQRDRVELEQGAGGEQQVGEHEAAAPGGPEGGDRQQGREEVEAAEQGAGRAEQQVDRVDGRVVMGAEPAEGEVAGQEQARHPVRIDRGVIPERRQHREGEDQDGERRVLDRQCVESVLAGPELDRIAVVDTDVAGPVGPVDGELDQPQEAHAEQRYIKGVLVQVALDRGAKKRTERHQVHLLFSKSVALFATDSLSAIKHDAVRTAG